MKKMILAIWCATLMQMSVHAELPDFTKVWQRTHIQQFEEAREELDNIWEHYKRKFQKTWEESHSDQSRHYVEEWMHFHMIKLYIAYKEGDQENMKAIGTNIQQLSYLEFLGTPIRP